MGPISSQSPQSFAYHYVLLGLTFYYAVEGGLKLICRRFRPDFHQKLKNDNRFLPFFGFAMGWLITLSSTPICIYAFMTNNPDASLHPSLSGQMCIGSRSILWVSELNRLEYLSAFIKHHFGALTHLMWHLHSDVTLAPLYLIYASLATELFSTATSMLTIAGYKSTNSLLARRTQQAHTIAVPLLRTPPVIYTAFSELPQLAGVQRIFAAIFLTGFLWSFLRSTPRELRRLDMLQDLSTWQTKVRSLNLFGIFVSAAYWALVLSTLNLYSMSGGSGSWRTVSFLLFQAALSGFVGARAPSILSGGGKLLAPTGYWQQSGVAASVMAVLLSPFSDLYLSQRLRLLSAAAVSLLLGEAVGRIGCHFAGCCGSSYGNAFVNMEKRPNNHGHKGISVPLLVTLLSFIAYIAVTAAFFVNSSNLFQAAAVSLALHGSIRMVAEAFRKDVPQSKTLGIKPTLAFAAVELLAGVLGMLLAPSVEQGSVQKVDTNPAGLFPIFTSLSLPEILAGFTQACSGSGMESLDSTGVAALAVPILVFGIAQVRSGSGMEAIEPSAVALALPSASLGLFTQACPGSGMESVENGDSTESVKLKAGQLMLPLSSIQPCGGV
ncbi:hypothetical protein AB5N19_06730 [Seiridium cardinale]|uniref:Dolichol kinase n=1 Tax=Seiridium cardinale TaxID=138064 RepID=A0ABR2XL25_9PEZI